MKKYINLNMILILGLVTPEMQVHGGKKAQIIGGTAGGVAYLGLLGGAAYWKKYSPKIEFKPKGLGGDSASENNGLDNNRYSFQHLDDNSQKGSFSSDYEVKPEEYDELKDLYTPEQIAAQREFFLQKKKEKEEDRKSILDNNTAYAYNPKSKHQYTDSDGKEFTVFKGKDTYTKYFKGGGSKTYYNKGLLRSETLKDDTFKIYNDGRIASVTKGKINRDYFYDSKNKTLTGYKDTDYHGNNIGSGSRVDGKMMHFGQNNKTIDSDDSGIFLTEDDENGIVQRDPGANKVGQRKTTVTTNEQNAASKNQADSGQKGKNQNYDEWNANADSYKGSNEPADENEGGFGSGEY
jgi:hypothetical protein